MAFLLAFLCGLAIPFTLALPLRSLPASRHLRRRILLGGTLLLHRAISSIPVFYPLSLPLTLGTVLGIVLALRWFRSG